MPNWLEAIRREATAVASAPVLFGGIVLVAMVVIWAALHWSYQALLSGKDMHIAMLDRRVAEYRKSVSGATPEDARRRIEILETEVKALRLRLQPRRLTAAQRQAIQDRTRLPAGAQAYEVTIVYEAECGDCKPFAADLAAALGASGDWNVSMQVMAHPFERPRAGLGIRVPDPLRPLPEAVILQGAFRSAGWLSQWLGEPPIRTSSYWLRNGPRSRCGKTSALAFPLKSRG